MSERKGTKALELWCKRLVKDCPDVRIDNMTTSWRNGIAFCALVHHFRPDLIDLSTLKPENIYENNQLAFNIAEKHLGIPALLDPEDMVDNVIPDRLSILTYLSQFYQRLGHTVNTKTAENEPKVSTPSPTHSNVPVMFGKTGFDKCAACGLPVYLAQRLIVSHKLYHRRCFRCTKCSGQLNPKNFEIVEGSEFCCDSCKNEKSVLNLFNNNDQMGMLAFSDDVREPETSIKEEPISSKQRIRPQSILDKINMFENNSEKESNIETKLGDLSIKDNLSYKSKDISTSSNLSITSGKHGESSSHNSEVDGNSSDTKPQLEDNELFADRDRSEKGYKSNVNKLNFLQAQLSGSENLNPHKSNNDPEDAAIVSKNEGHDKNVQEVKETTDSNSSDNVLNDESNITDDIRIAKSRNTSPNSEIPLDNNKTSTENYNNEKISVPPRRKKLQNSPTKPNDSEKVTDSVTKVTDYKEYPDHLNPFSDDEDEEENDNTQQAKKRVSTNPFGSSDEEEDEVQPIPPSKPILSQTTPGKRVIAAPCNPFWSDGEEPLSDEASNDKTSDIYKSSITTSTPNLPASTPRRKKAPAPPPPPIITVDTLDPSTSMDDVASISSLSSYNSTVHSDHKSYGKITPRLKKKRLAPTPLDSLSTVSFGAGSMEIGIDGAGKLNASDGSSRRLKGPAPGLPLPERREVKLQMSSDELQIQLDMLETQQLGLERQGVLIEQMIRDKCEGDEATAASVPQEEVEDLVIQLCELVNEKNDLFRKQTELMYIRRQQRLEQEQADIEHEIRVIQSRPAVNRIDADKAREEQLVSRLVQIVRMRDELVQQIDAERRRERQEDIAIATSIASKRAQRNVGSNSSSLKSGDVSTTPKKSKVKDKVKKQLKKAKNSLIHKKKDDALDRKEEKAGKKSK